MAGFPNIPGLGGGSPGAAGPPPQIPGVTQPQTPAPQQLIQALMKRPEQASQLIRQAVLLLNQAADLDPRLEDRLKAAAKLIQGPAKPDSEV